jgi:hypothetical protein
MSTSSEPAHLDPSNPIYYAPRSLRERAKSRNITSELPKDNSPPYFESSLMEAIEKATRSPLDPEAVDAPLGYDKGLGQWTVAWWSAVAVGGLALLALTLVIAIAFWRDHAQESSASSVLALPKTALKQAPRADQSKPALAEFTTGQAIDRANQATQPARTHAQSEALLNRFLQWQQNLDSTDHPAR